MEEPLIPWSRVAAFIRQHTHDVRNDLNGIELESALLHEVVPVGEAKDGVTRIRKQVRNLAEKMRQLSARFQSSQPIAGPMPARSLLTIWRDRHTAFPNAPDVLWVDELKDEEIKVDVQMLADAFQELLSNAATFRDDGPVMITAKADKNGVAFEFREPKKTVLDTTHWGQPLFTTRRGSQGLGLATARRLVEANHGRFDQRFDSGESALITRIVLPQAG